MAKIIPLDQEEEEEEDLPNFPPFCSLLLRRVRRPKETTCRVKRSINGSTDRPTDSQFAERAEKKKKDEDKKMKNI